MKKKISKFRSATKFKAIDAFIDKWATETVSRYITKKKRIIVNKPHEQGVAAQITLDINALGEIIGAKSTITTELCVVDKSCQFVATRRGFHTKLKWAKPMKFSLPFPSLVGTRLAKVGSLPVKGEKTKRRK